MTDPITTALTAYGINPLHTPETFECQYTKSGIIIDQFIQLSDEPGDVACHEEDLARPVEPVRIRKFFPHPSTGDPE